MSQLDHVSTWVYLVEEKHVVHILITMTMESSICYILKEIIKEASHLILLE